MKHLATGVVILLLCLALCFTSLAVLDRWTTHATSQLEQALELADREYFDEAEALVTETWEFWRRRRGFFGMVLRHAEADQVNSTFRQLVEYAQNGCSEEFEPTCADLIEQINHLCDMEKPYYYNVLQGVRVRAAGRRPDTSPYKQQPRIPLGIRGCTMYKWFWNLIRNWFTKFFSMAA